MSNIEEIKQNFSNNDVQEFKQIPQSHPFRRNQSEFLQNPKLNNITINDMNFNRYQIPVRKEKSFHVSTNNAGNQRNVVQQQPKTLIKSQSTVDMRRGFNPMDHIPPRYDLYGYLKPLEKRVADISLLKEKDSIKMPWCTKNTNKSGAMTRTELIEMRRKEKIPDISYDLDNDGFVGGRDLVLSKLYDKDKNGKLNEEEKKAALEGIANHIEDKYMWNIDNQGGKRGFRVLQKRGKIIDGDDFWQIRETYPAHPLSKIKPKCSTFTELKQLRKNEKINAVMKNLEDYEAKNPSKLIFSSNNNMYNTLDLKKPLFTSIQQIRDENLKNARIKCGLDPETSDYRDIKKHPGLEYVDNPRYKTQKEIKESYKQENLEESKKLQNIIRKSDIERLNDREDEIFAKLYSDKERLTYSKIKEQKRKEINEFNIKTFSSQALGVHGHELPKFSESETNKEFWKFKDGYCENPKFQSQCEYLESIKYYKPPGEDLLLNEHRDEEPNWIDPFKKVHILEAKHKKENLITKVNNINIFKNFDPNNPKPIDYASVKKHIYRWTTLVNQFAPNKFKKGRFFDSLPEDAERLREKEKAKAKEKAALLSDYMNKTNQKSDIFSMKTKESNANPENNIVAKDFLFQKYAAKDTNKNIVPKNGTVRTKGF